MSATFRRQVRKLESTKDALRDQLFDLKSLVRRSFGTLSSEVVDLADQIVAGANDLSEIAICKRLTGDDDGNPSKSVLAVFNKIDSMHNAMEIAGIRRRRVNPTPSGTNLLESSSGGPTVSVDIPVATLSAGNPPLSPPPPLSADRPQVENCVEAASHENGTHEERIDSVGVEEVLGAAADEALQAGNYSSTLVQDESIADPNSQVCVGAGPSLVELDSQDAGTRSRHRTCGFSKSDISSVTPSSLREASQLRLDTLITLQREVLAGALQANRRLVAAKRWVADAPLPLAASVDGLLLEIDALKRHLQEESLSLAVASFPMAAPPLRSSHVKAMKQQRKQLGSPRRAVQSPLSPRSVSLGTLRTPQSDPFVPVSFLSAKRSGTSFVEGEQAAIETRVKQKEGLQRLQRQQLRVLHHQQSTSAVGDPTLRTMLPIAQALKQREGTSSDDIKKILHAVKVEVHHLGRQPLPMRGVSRGVGNLPVLVQGGGSRESGGAETPAEEILVFCPDNRSTTAETLMTNLHPSNAGITRAGTPCLPVFVPKHHAQDRSKSSLR